MTIGLVLYPLGNEKGSGLGRMAFALAGEMMRQHPKEYFIVYTKGPLQEKLDFGCNNYEMHVSRGGLLWLDRLLWRAPQADVYYFSTPVLPFVRVPKHSVAVVYDFAYLSPYVKISLPWKNLIRWMQKCSLVRATAVIAISEFTKGETVRLLDISPEKIKIASVGINDVCAVLPEPVAVTEPFLLYAGGMKERKNVKNIVRGYALARKTLESLSPALVLTGGIGGEFGRSVQALARELGVEDYVHFLGVVTSGQLSYLYGRAFGFVFPSRLEGFGMAALEAMACGIPTIASTAGGLKEAVGDGALIVNPESQQEIADAMACISTDKKLRRDLSERGQARAAQFSWARAAGETYEVLKSLV